MITLPGFEGQTLYDPYNVAGTQVINDPYANQTYGLNIDPYAGGGEGGGGGGGWGPTSDTLDTSTYSSGYSTGSTGGSTYDAEAAQKAQQQELYKQALNTTIAQLEGQLGTLGSQEGEANTRVTDQYNLTGGRLSQDYSLGKQNLAEATNDVTASKERSLYNLRQWLAAQGQGYQNQLGAMGAGDSSATGMVNFALGRQGARERGNVISDAAQQFGDIQKQGQQLQLSYDRNKQDLDLWKQTTLADIARRFAESRNQVNASILDARARAAAEQELTQEAINQLAALEQQYRSDATNLQNMYAQQAGPTQTLNKSLLDYTTRPVAQPNLTGIKMPSYVNPESNYTAFLKRQDEEQFANPLGV